MEKILVKDIMKTEITVAGPHQKFSQFMYFFYLFNIRHIPVTENDRILGIISIRDVLRILCKKLAAGESISLQHLDDQYTAAAIMTPSPVTVTPEDTLKEVILLLSNVQLHALPVAKNGIVKGIVTQHDLVASYSKEKHPPHYEIGSPGFGF